MASVKLPRSIRGVLFDLDNTLHDRDEAFAAWAADFVTKKLGVTDAREQSETLDLIHDLDRGGAGDKIVLFESVKAKYPALEGSPRELLSEFFARRTDYMRLGDSVADVLASLDSRRIPWGIVTNGGREQWDKLRAMALDKATDHITVSSDFGRHKPDPAIFLSASEKIGVAPGDVLFVGDHVVSDMQGAAGVGMMTAWIRRGRTWPSRSSGTAPDAIVDDLAELIALLPAAQGEH